MNIKNEIDKINKDSIYDFNLILDENDISDILENDNRNYEMNKVDSLINDYDFYYDSFFE